ncbi:MAG TPA: hypothetical protein VF465_16530 [Flavobacterium sp.]|uniref:TRAFAC clade GTPase domain-containing protein n=1 Tax=Flavobacterium sp. TaxID=239 RepID=UPI002ED60453
MNGLELDECPHYSKEDNDNVAAQEINDEDLDQDDQDNQSFLKANEVNRENLKDVHSGKALTLDEANKIAKSVLARVIVLAGMPEAGKTTLLLTLMHLFSSKLSFKEYIFAGSQTLIDFEEKSHPSKIDSDISTPETGRTPVGPHTFMHIGVADLATLNNKINLLFTDISGETFKALKDSAEECQKFELGARADHFVLFFDTKDLTSLKERANSKAAGLGMLRGLTEAGTLLPTTKIQIVFSKWDLFDQEKKENNLQFLEVLKDEIRKNYGEKYAVSFYEISCRSKDGTFTFGYGLDKLFLSWVNQSQLDHNEIQNSEVENEFELSQFLKFKYNQ